MPCGIGRWLVGLLAVVIGGLGVRQTLRELQQLAH
jgi:hypothetical protein